MAKEICQECGQVFEPKTNRAFFCPECVRRKVSESAKRRGLSKIGNEAYSKQCAERRARERRKKKRKF